MNCVLILKTSPGWFHYELWGILGFLFACIGFNVMHDGAMEVFLKDRRGIRCQGIHSISWDVLYFLEIET